MVVPGTDSLQIPGTSAGTMEPAEPVFGITPGTAEPVLELL